MKALILNSTGQPNEAFALAKSALKNDMKSHVCWHVYGLLYRSIKNFEEAIKAYRFALKLEPESVQIQRDLALLQIQMRDYNGYVQSRRTMLQARPQLRHNWTALAVAHHLAGNLSAAENVLKTYEGTLKTPPPRTDVEHSEALLYRNSIIAEIGEIERALDHLETFFKQNLDRTSVMEMRADYNLKLGRLSEAEKAYRALLDRNCEYRQYFEGLEKSLAIDKSSKDSTQRLTSLYDSFATEKGERIDAAKRIPLDFIEGDAFRKVADTYLQQMLQRGVPSTFANVKALYSNEEKKKVIESLVEGYASSQDSNMDSNRLDETSHEQFYESVLYFLAQHYNYQLSRDLDKAMKLIDQAIDRKPSSVDFHMTKARILKHYGDTEKAAEVMDHARKQDERDRYINTKCAKYQLRDNANEKALKTMSKFTRNETAGGPLGDLHDMQCMWFLTEDGEAYFRQGKLGLALKRFKSIYDIFDIWQEDQFDFHNFSLRKGQIRAYIDMVRWEDGLRQHPFYARAAISAIEIYILLHDNPTLSRASMMNGVSESMNGMDANERKKAMKKAKREQDRQEKADAEKRDAEKKAAQKKPSAGGDGEPKKEDVDPQGRGLVQTKAPLEMAMKYLNPLLEFSPKNVEGQNAGYEVFMRKSMFCLSDPSIGRKTSLTESVIEKYLLALRCLLAARSVDPEDPTLHEQIIRFQKTGKFGLDPLVSIPCFNVRFRADYVPLSPSRSSLPLVSELSESLPEKVSTTISTGTEVFPSTSTLNDYNDKFLAKHSNSPRHIHGALRARALLKPETKAQNERELLETLDFDDSRMDLESAVQGLQLLVEWNCDREFRTAYLDKAKARYKDATVFRNATAVIT